MSIIAPPVRKHLSADALFRLIHNDFARLPDSRVGNTEIALEPIPIGQLGDT